MRADVGDFGGFGSKKEQRRVLGKMRAVTTKSAYKRHPIKKDPRA